jgi:hypothetical protein
VDTTSYVKKTKGKGYCVKSEHNPDWSGGCYPTKAEANKRLEQVEAAKHAKASGLLTLAEELEAAIPVNKTPPLGKYDIDFKKKPRRVPTEKNPYKPDEEARRLLPKPPPIRKPDVEEDEEDEGEEPVKTPRKRDKSDAEYESVDAFATFLADNDESTFDREDIVNLNFRTQTPTHKIIKELEDYGFTQVEHKVEKKPRGVSDNPHGTHPFSGMSGGAAYQSVIDSKYGRKPFEEG